MRKTAIVLLFAFSIIQLNVSAQMPESFSSAEIFLRLKKLNVLGTVLYVAAHPDDENSRLIAYLTKDRLYRTGYLSLTRGDGGQNMIGDMQGVELGLIRTQEMLAARKIDGAEQFFSRAFDFGYTKTAEEALNVWNKEKILSDVVWVIRKFQPDVLITRFGPKINQAFHGQHAAATMLAIEAFTAAADPKRFPEQFKYGVKPWQAKRILWNSFVFGSINTTSNDQMKLDVGSFNPILGEGYGEIAAESRTLHKTQGAALVKLRGQLLEYFSPLAGDPPAGDIMDGVNTSWSRVEGGERIQPLVDQLLQKFSLSNPEKSIAGLITLYRALMNLPEGYWRNEKLTETRQLIEICSGLWLEAYVTQPYLVQGDSIKINVTMYNRVNDQIKVATVRVNGQDTVLQTTLELNKEYAFKKTIFISKDQPITQPYWLVSAMSPGSYNVNDQTLIGRPQGDPAVQVIFNVIIEGQEFSFMRPLVFRQFERLNGDIFQPVTIVPPVTGRFNPELVIFTNGDPKSFDLDTKEMGISRTSPSISLTDSAVLSFTRESVFHSSRFTYSAKPPSKILPPQYSTALYDKTEQKDTVTRMETFSFEHIPRIDYFLPAKVKFVEADLKIAGKRIGYIDGTGDKVPEGLEQMGYEVVHLKESDISPAKLRQFDAVILGIRVYEVHPSLTDNYMVLMDYVKEGGNLIMQYSQVNGLPQNIKFGPYPFRISGNRVTDENAKVNFLIPNHPVLNFPNKITDKDFDGWVQERGSYFADKIDSAYQLVFSMHDPGEPDQKGSLIIGDYGKGKFVYTGLVFFRQLPAGVPGAYRLLANIIALNYKRGF